MARDNITYQLFLTGKVRRPVFTVTCPCGFTASTPTALTEREAETMAKNIADRHNQERRHNYILRRVT